MQATSASPDRARLAAQQAALVRSLVTADAPPSGFDTQRVKIYGNQLAEKRLVGVSVVWIQLTRSLGDRYRPLFRAYSREFAHPRWGHGLVDGLLFARWLDRLGLLTNEGRMEKLEVELRSRAAGRHRVARRGPAFGVTLLTKPRRIVIAFRLPWIGEKWFVLAAPSAQPQPGVTQ